MERPAYIPMFEDMLLAFDCLDDVELRKALRMIRAYYFDGQAPTDEPSPARAMFLGFKASMDKSLSRIKANRENGKRRAKSYRDAHQTESSDVPEDSQPMASSKPSRAQILANSLKREAEVKPAEAKPKPKATQKKAKAKPAQTQTAPKEDKTKDQGPKTKDQEEKSVAHAPKPPRPLPKFKPPTTEDEQAAFTEEAQAYGNAYCIANGLPEGTFDAGRFTDHFASNGWKVGGKAPMRDWHAAVRNWIRNDHPQLGGGAKADGWADKYAVPEAIVVD